LVNISSQTTKCYTGLKDSCSVSDVHNCTATSRTVCEPHPYNAIICNADGSNCRIAYQDNACVTKTSYHGPFCEISPSCQQEFCMTQDIFTINQVEIAGNQSIFESEDCKNISGSGVNGTYFVKTSNCRDKSYCNLAESSQTDVLCMEDTNSLGENIFVHAGDKKVFCFDESFQTLGDYWCPKGFVYFSDQGICRKDTTVCDQGFAGNLQNGCDTPLNPKDDYWRLYQDNCVFNKITPEGLYDSACCLDSVFNNYQIWQEEADADHVKVY